MDEKCLEAFEEVGTFRVVEQLEFEEKEVESSIK